MWAESTEKASYFKGEEFITNRRQSKLDTFYESFIIYKVVRDGKYKFILRF